MILVVLLLRKKSCLSSSLCGMSGVYSTETTSSMVVVFSERISLQDILRVTKSYQHEEETRSAESVAVIQR